MKTALYSILFLFFSARVFCQKIRFTDPTNFWKVQELYRFGTNSTVYYYDFKYGVDTIIGGKTYKQFITNFPENAFVREDTQTNIVYYYNANTLDEDTLYNYNLVVGDTIRYSKVAYFEDKVFYVDSILISGVYHRRFDFQCVNCNQYQSQRWYSVVEGVGSLSGPYFPGVFGVCVSGASEYIYDIVCFSENNIAASFSASNMSDCQGTIDFTNTNTCWPASVNNLQLSINNWQLYPNPFKNELTIETTPSFTIGELLTLSIYDMLGKVVYSSSINKDKANLSLDDLNNGIYIVQLDFPDGSRQIKKIMKE